MAKIIFGNNCVSTIAGNVLAADTTITLASGTGASFPAPGPDEYLVAQFVDTATANLFEIVHVTARAGDDLTVVRAQEGTTALNWLSGDIFASMWTAGQAAAMQQQGETQSQSANYGVDTGTANAYFCTVSPALTSYSAGLPIRVKILNSSTGPSTLNVGPGVRNIKHPDGSDIGTGDLIAGGIYEFIYDGTVFFLSSQVWPLPNAGLANVPSATFKGRTAAGVGKPQDLSVSQATALLNSFIGDSGSGGLKGLVPPPAAGDAAAGKSLLASGLWGLISLALQDASVVKNGFGASFKIGTVHIQMGVVSTVSGDTSVTATFPVAFSSPPDFRYASVNRSTFTLGTEGLAETNGNPSTTSMTVSNNSIVGSPVIDIFWIAVRVA